MKIAIVGTGYVGLVTGTCLAEAGFDVTCVDINQNKIETLKKGISPIYEPGIEDLIEHNIDKGRLHFTTSLAEIMDEVTVIFSAVGTPPDEDGSADLQYVLNVAREVGQNMHDYKLLVTKSTVPVGTAKKVRAALQEELDKRGVSIEFDVASNPEFLKEGDAVNDFMHPDRIVVGTDSEKAKELMGKIYKSFAISANKIIFTDIASAEMIKYAANAMLATRISFMNDIANLCEKVGANINMIRQGIGSDTRIGSKFLYAGTGYGGSCFPKDVKALIKTADQNGYSLDILKAVESVNERQKEILFHKLSQHLHGDLAGKTVAMLGLAFKPNTDDMREAPALVLIDKLTKANCKVKVFDPVAMEECYRRVGNIVEYCDNIYDTLKEADALLVVTEWREFKALDLAKAKTLMHNALILDGRNIYDPKEMRALGIQYDCIGGAR